MQGSVSITIDAPPALVWDIVTDVTRIGQFSPETFEAEWRNGATGPELGAKFRGHVKRNGIGPVYWSDCEVTTCEPLKHFEFSVGSGNAHLNNWGYKLAEVDGGTEVTEYFRMEQSGLTKVYWGLLGKLRGKTNERGMRQTLERIKAVAEADANA